MVKFAAECFAIAALGLAVTRPSAASAEQLVTFDSAGARVGQGELSGVRGYLSRPNGRGPFPAVVLLHSCLGLPVNRRVIGEAMARWGYVALFVDDFATRGLEQTCAVDFPEGVADAFGALRYLAKLPYVDPSRIAAVGYSQGADTALAISTSRYAAGLAPSEDPKFKAAAAFYPPCENQGGARLRIPTSILVGALDEVTPAGDCERLANEQPTDRPEVKLVVYPGAAHGFDNPGFAGGMRLLGMRLAYDRRAAEESSADLRDFLARNLAR